jgi:undecaprenyl diphosphate synthase
MIKSMKRLMGSMGNDTSSAEDLLEKIKKAPMPKHVAIITDGNGRWAKKRGMPRTAGHAAGMKRIREIIRAADDLGVEVLTFYSFSTENWKRPKDEVEYLMKLPMEFLKTDLQELMKRNVKVRILGGISKTPDYTQKALMEFEEKTKDNTGLILNFAINYGARSEIIEAVHRIIEDIENGHIDKGEVNEELMSEYLLTKGLPDPDLVIRTSGEIRVSNFLLWQLAYSELWFTDVLWPDFSSECFYQAIEDFQHRSRRFGAV